MKIAIPKHSLDHPYICYHGNVYIIEEFENKGNKVNIQYGGVSCLQTKVKGFIRHKFRPKISELKPSYWERQTAWAYPVKKDRIYFSHDISEVFSILRLGGHFVSMADTIEDINNKAYKFYDEATPVKHILLKIKREIESQIKEKVSFPFDIETAQIEIDFNESYLPILINGKQYICTWENCD